MKARNLLFLFLLWFFYLTLGVLVFRAVEHDGEEQREKTKQQQLVVIKDKITSAYNMSEAEFFNIVKQIEAASSSNGGPEWSYHESVSFVIQLVTTIGYGNITPVTNGGRVLCIVFAFFGIPINILFLQSVGKSLREVEKFLITEFEKRCLKRNEEPKFLNEKCSLCAVVFFFTLLLFSAAVQQKIDEWTFLEGFYAYFITFTTVGFGDLIPGGSPTESPVRNTVVRIVFIILGLAAMSNVLIAVMDSTECLKYLKTCKIFRRSGETVDIPETKEGGGGIELTDYRKEDPKNNDLELVAAI